MSDFENQSAIEQLDNLNNVVVETVNSYKELFEEKKKQLEIDKESLEIEQKKADLEYNKSKRIINDLQYKHEKGLLTISETEYQKELEYWKTKEEKSAEYLNTVKDNLSDLEDALDHFTEEANNKFFNGLMDEADGLIAKVKLLKDAVSPIGEGWAVSADKVEEFAKNFPELMESQKNYNYLQDGSLHLTEEGQEAFKDMLELRKEEIILQNESYKKELQIEADKQYALYEYYKGVSNILQKILMGK